ncbi:MAG: lipid-binding SYLF domain-containing protein [Candidatus Omnitrophota bacterium]|jgi:lipid-binding SYLF domain-containing protein
MKLILEKLFVGCIVIAAFGLGFVSLAQAGTASSIDAGVELSLERLYEEVAGSKVLLKDAKGVLVFPSVLKAGIGIGAEYGEGALLIKGKNEGYYSTAAASIGLQLGAQKKTVVVAFMDSKALKNFRASSGWKAGVDASVAVVKVGAGGAVDTTQYDQPILGFIIGQKGLMYNLTLEGSKFTKIVK